MIFIGLLIGFYIGILVGGAIVGKLQKSMFKDYKKDVDYWFDSYMKLLKDYNQMSIMYVKEATKNMFHD